MNERIQKLAEQANLQLIIDDGDFDLRKFAEKFAELIVAECVAAAEEAQADFYIVHNIKLRFGIEE